MFPGLFSKVTNNEQGLQFTFVKLLNAFFGLLVYDTYHFGRLRRARVLLFT